MTELHNDMEQPGDAPPGAPPPSGIAGVLVRITFIVGSFALLAAMATETAAVIGRHIGVPFLGSIELVQAFVVLATSSAIVGATVLGAHATVHLLIERLSPKTRKWLQRFADLTSAVVFAVLAFGSMWIFSEVIGGDEKTQLLGLPVAPLRAFWCGSALLTALLFLIYALRPSGGPSNGGHS